jgi:hypothetical protein
MGEGGENGGKEINELHVYGTRRAEGQESRAREQTGQRDSSNEAHAKTGVEHRSNGPW